MLLLHAALVAYVPATGSSAREQDSALVQQETNWTAATSSSGPSCSQRLHVEGILCSERYAQRIRCAGKTLLFTRLEYFKQNAPLHDTRYVQLYRTATDVAGLRFGPPTSLGALEGHRIAHPAIACTESDQLVWFATPPLSESRQDLGIYRRVGTFTSAGFSWINEWEFILSLQQNESGCIEQLRPFVRERSGLCAFDSKLSAIRLSSGAWMLFARANLGTKTGGRHVQAAISDSNGSFAESQFRLLTIPGFANATAGTAAEHQNIYYLTVRKVRIGSREALLGCFPGNAGSEAGLFCTTSDDGFVWQRPQLLQPSAMHESDRTTDHPLSDSGFPSLELGTRGITLAVEHGVQVPDIAEEDETEEDRKRRLARHQVPYWVRLDPGADGADDDGEPQQGEPICLDCFNDEIPSFCEHRYDMSFQ